MSIKTLLLNNTYEPLALLCEKRALKLLFKEEKVEIISSWDNHIIKWDKGQIAHPSILRLKHYVRVPFSAICFSRKWLVKRDNSTCQYCSLKLTASQITIDHVIPRSRGGGTCFENCVVCCHKCNSIKANQTPEEANMKLLRKPIVPNYYSLSLLSSNFEYWSDSWNDYLSGSTL